MRVLLTGGYGFFGAWIVRNLIERGDEAFIYDLREDAYRLRLIMPEEQVRRVSFVAGDVTDQVGLKGAIDRNPETSRKRYLSAAEIARLTAALAECASQPAANAIRLLMLTGARPSIFFRRRRIGRRNSSYFLESRMSSMARMTTASTPSSPTHCGVMSFGKSRWT